jgi:hypothetical protein
MYATILVVGEPPKAHDDLAITIGLVATCTHKENNLEIVNGLDKAEVSVVEVEKTKPCPWKRKLTSPNKKTMLGVNFFGTNVLSFGI